MIATVLGQWKIVISLAIPWTVSALARRVWGVDSVIAARVVASASLKLGVKVCQLVQLHLSLIVII